MDTVIEFYDQEDKPVGTITIKADGSMVGSTPNQQDFADEWRASGQTPEAFIRKYAQWGNGYQGSQQIEP